MTAPKLGSSNLYNEALEIARKTLAYGDFDLLALGKYTRLQNVSAALLSAEEMLKEAEKYIKIAYEEPIYRNSGLIKQWLATRKEQVGE